MTVMIVVLEKDGYGSTAAAMTGMVASPKKGARDIARPVVARLHAGGSQTASLLLPTSLVWLYKLC